MRFLALKPTVSLSVPSHDHDRLNRIRHLIDLIARHRIFVPRKPHAGSIRDNRFTVLDVHRSFEDRLGAIDIFQKRPMKAVILAFLN